MNSLFLPRAMPARAFKHVSDAAGLGIHHGSHELQLLSAEAAQLANLALKLRDLLS